MWIPNTKQHIYSSLSILYVGKYQTRLTQTTHLHLTHTHTHKRTAHHNQLQQQHQFKTQGILNHLKETVEKNWNEKKDEFGGRQKGKHFVLRVFQLYKLPNHSV